MDEAEEKIRELEETIPYLAAEAFAAARQAALDAGHSVWGSHNGIVYELFPDGTRIERKRIAPPTYIPVGTRLIIP